MSKFVDTSLNFRLLFALNSQALFLISCFLAIVLCSHAHLVSGYLHVKEGFCYWLPAVFTSSIPARWLKLAACYLTGCTK